MSSKNPIILAITGASGIIYAFRILEFFLKNNYMIHLILSEAAVKVANSELKTSLGADIQGNKEQILTYLNLPKRDEHLVLHSNNNLFASISSGSYPVDGMIILPCSMNTVALIRAGIANSLITRAADVCMKQGRKLVLAPREMPFSSTHLENMLALSLKGVKIAVPAPAFYHQPEHFDDMINFVAGNILDTFEVHNDLYKRWN